MNFIMIGLLLREALDRFRIRLNIGLSCCVCNCFQLYSAKQLFAHERNRVSGDILQQRLMQVGGLTRVTRKWTDLLGTWENGWWWLVTVTKRPRRVASLSESSARIAQLPVKCDLLHRPVSATQAVPRGRSLALALQWGRLKTWEWKWQTCSHP